MQHKTGLFQDEQLYGKEQKEDLIQSKIRQAVPGLNALDLKENHWQKLINSVTNQQVKRITSQFVLLSLSDILDIDYHNLLAAIKNEQPLRNTKPFITSSEIGYKKMKKFKSANSHDENRLISPIMEENGNIDMKLAKTGVRITRLESAEDTNGYKDVMQTPSKTKVRPFYSNGFYRFYTPLTPYKNKNGMVNVESASLENIKKTLPRLSHDKPERIFFTATLAKIDERKNRKRRLNQNSVMKASCREVFAAHGVNIEATEGNVYHWSHQIAWFLGGSQSRNNLIPSTSAANYNALELVERFIAERLQLQKTERVDVTVTPQYSAESLIPNTIQYDMTWQEANGERSEKIVLNPRSHQRISHAMHNSITVIRNLEETFDGEDLNNGNLEMKTCKRSLNF